MHKLHPEKAENTDQVSFSTDCKDSEGHNDIDLAANHLHLQSPFLQVEC